MIKNEHQEPESDLPAGLAKPAQRALAGAGYVRLEQLAKLSARPMSCACTAWGRKRMDQIRRALAAKGLSFADSAAEEGSAR